jgi:hypothetical protein
MSAAPLATDVAASNIIGVKLRKNRSDLSKAFAGSPAGMAKRRLRFFGRGFSIYLQAAPARQPIGAEHDPQLDQRADQTIWHRPLPKCT